MNKETKLQYKLDEPVYVKNAVSFDFGLPFNAFLSKSHFTMTNAGTGETFGFIFNCKEIKENMDDEKWPIKIAYLYVKTAFFDLKAPEEPWGEKQSSIFLSDAFDRLIVYLNNFLSSYIVITKDTFPSFVSLHSSPLALWCYYDINKKLTKDELMPYLVKEFENQKKKGILTLDWARSTKGMTELPQLDNAVYSKIMYYMSLEASGNSNPFYNSELFYVLAKKHMEEANYSASIVFMQTSIENFLCALLSILGLDSELAKKFTSVSAYLSSEETSFSKILRRSFQNHFSGINWNFRAPTSQLYSYYQKVYLLRNKTIHSGYMPRVEEVREAFDEISKLREFLTKEIKKQYGPIYKQYLE